MASTITVGVLRALLTLDQAQFESGMRQAAGSAKKFESDMKRLGSNFTGLGTTLTAAVSVPIVAAFGSAAKAAIDFESSFAGVRKTVDASEAEFKVMEQQFRDLAKTIPVNVNELNRLGEAAGALGIPKKDIVDFARVMAELGVTTNLTSDQAADAIARIQNIFGAAGKDTERLASTIVALGNAGASTESEITEMAQRIAGAGHTVGLTQAQVVGFASTLASVGINAEAGGTAISRVFLKMNDAVMAGGAGLQAFAQVAGKSSADFKKAFETDAANATVMFVNGLARMKAEGQNINQVIEGLTGKNIILKDTLLRLVGAGGELTRQLDVANTAWRENTALTEEARKRFETTEQKLVVLWNRLKDVAITFGNALLPAVNTAITVFDALMPLIDGVAKGFAALPGPVQALIIGIAGIAAAVGPVLFIFGQLALAVGTLTGIGGFGGLMASIGKLVGISGFGGLATAIGGVTKVLGAFLTWPWGALLAAAVLLAPILWEMVGGWEGIKKAVAAVIAPFESMLSFLGDLGTIGWHFATVVLNKIGEMFVWLGGIGRAAHDWIVGIIDKLGILQQAWDYSPLGLFFKAIGSAAELAKVEVAGLALEIRNAADVAKQLDKAAADLKNTGFNKQVAGNALKVPDIAELEQYEAALNRIPAPLKKISTLTAEAEDKTKKTKEATFDWETAVEKVRDKMKAIAFEGHKRIIAEERKTAEETADAWLKAFNVRTEAERDLTRITREQGFARAQAEIDYAKQHGATWQELYAMERRLADARLQAAIDDAELEFQVRTAGMDKTTEHGRAAYEALRAAHDAKIAGMVETHQRAEALKREELLRTHDVWARSIDGIKALWASLTTTISDHLTQALMRATSFKDAFVNIWQSIKESLLKIFSDILNSFIKTVLDGALGAIMGRKGAFSQAFGGLFGGFGGGGAGGGGLLDNLIGGGLTSLLGGGGGGATTMVLGGIPVVAGTGAAGGVGAAATGGAAAGGGGFGAAVAGLATNPITIAAAGALILGLGIWKKGWFRGGEEGTQVNPARDEFFAGFQQQFGGSQFEAMAKAFASAGVSGDIAERLIKQLYDADTMKEFEAATTAIREALAGATAEANETAAAMTQLTATAASLKDHGSASVESITALQAAIAGMSGASAEQIASLNAELTSMIASGTATDAAIAALTARITQMAAGAAAASDATTAGVTKMQATVNQLNATVSQLSAVGSVSEEAVNALRKQIADLSSVTDPQVIENLNATLVRMIEEGTATDETIAVLAQTVEMMRDQANQTTDSTGDLTDASGDLETQYDRNCFLTNEMRQRLAELERQTGSATDAWRRLTEELLRPIDVQINVPTIDLGNYIQERGSWVPDAPSFATEGIARAPMLAMVGDAGANNPEWILHQSTLGAALGQAFSFGSAIGGIQASAGASTLSVDRPRASAGGVQIGSLSVSVQLDGAGKNAPTLARELLDAIPQAMRMDHNLVKKMRTGLGVA